jgi:SAM-dependent methyltransferase
MTDTPAANAAQIDYWNATAGPTWVAFQERLDRQIEPLGREAMARLAPVAGERVLDIGCGCGQTTLALAERVGASGTVIGADISAPMLAVARARPLAAGAARPSFRECDAQIENLAEDVPGGFDAAFSRFGVMFFADPAAAFANIRRALKPGGRLAFVCWRAFAENPWMNLPAAAAAPLLPPSPSPDPTAPGPFAFADAERVRGILGQAGFGSILIEAFDARIGGGDVDQTVELAFKVGPLGAALREAPERAGAVTEVVRAAIAPFATPDGVKMPAAVWIVQARNEAAS